MMAERTAMLGLLVVVLLAPIADASAEKPATDSTESTRTVVCFGDSITKRGYPAILGEQLGADAINAGVAGHTSGQGLRRMKSDVLDKNPDVVVIFFGTNDLRVDAKKHVPIADYKSNLETMVQACRKQNASVVLCTLPPIDHDKYFQKHERELYDAAGGLAKLITGYQNAAIQVAAEKKVKLVDLQLLLASDPKWLSDDGVHPSKAGCVLIANHIAKTLEPLLHCREISAGPLN